MVTASTSCCEQMSFGYTLNTQFAHPESQTRGSADPNATERITTSAIYNFNTSLTISATDANQRQTEMSYFAATLCELSASMRDLAKQKVVTWRHAEKRCSDIDRVTGAWPWVEAVSEGSRTAEAVARGVVGSSCGSRRARRDIPNRAQFAPGLREPEEKS